MTDLRIEPKKLVATAERLERRIQERFEGSGLGRVCGELVKRASQAEQACQQIREPHWRLRALSGTIVAVIVLIALGAAWVAIENASTAASPFDWRDIPTVGESVANEVLLLAAAIWFFVTLERKRKRERVIGAMNQLRTLAHLIDIHQLAKHPEMIGVTDRDTASSPKRELDPFEMGRYLDYCSEMLALTGKVAALYGEAFEDPEANEAVNDLEEICIGLSRKIWQKIILLEARTGRRVAILPRSDA
ncbi:MAG: hypothetical protein KC619_07360 [Myxococcales bacterium]|nr:hypothetical protein [Myxococcales bacterium]